MQMLLIHVLSPIIQSKYQVNLETSMKGSDLIFNSVQTNVLQVS